VAVRRVVVYPNSILKQVAAPVQAADVERVRADLLDTMTAHERCAGIAAPQIGELVRMAAVDVSEHPKATSSNGLVVLVNPVIVEREGAEIGREGCLSIPDLTGNVRRATRVVVEHAGGRVESEGFEARCIQHEIDHLDGILFLDRVESIVDDVFRRRVYSAEPGSSRPRDVARDRASSPRSTPEGSG
jgi:peptide deformylase